MGGLAMHVSRRVIRQGGLAGLTAVTLIFFILATVRYMPTAPASWSEAVDAGWASIADKVGNGAGFFDTEKSTPVPVHGAPRPTPITSGTGRPPRPFTPSTAASSASANAAQPSSSLKISLADVVGRMLVAFPPSDKPTRWKEDRFGSQKWQWDQPEVELIDKVALNGSEIVKMRDAHRGYLDAIDELLPEYVQYHFEGQPSFPQNRGIVTIGGGKYFPIFLVSLRFLRRTGTTLPVEVFVPENEYEADVCENVLPALNAICRVLPKLGGGAGSLGGFQLKAFALLFSTFDELIWLDADCTAMRNLEPYFKQEPFQSTGLVTWPDLWQLSASPLYYIISEQDVVPVSVRASSETGQLMLSKTRHWRTLLLIVYYNYYGPSYYYRLLSQGGTGMGDKDTFLPAADVFGLPYYHVRKPVVQVGHRFEDGSTGSRVSVQYDVLEDYAATMELAGSNKTTIVWEKWHAAYGPVHPLFLHLSWPKWDATNLLDHISKWSDMTTGVNGKPEPNFHWPEDLAAEIRGTERMLWEEATWCICNLHDRLRHWSAVNRAGRMCDRLQSHFRNVLDGETGKSIGLGPDDVLYPKLPTIKLRPKPSAESKDGEGKDKDKTKSN